MRSASFMMILAVVLLVSCSSKQGGSSGTSAIAKQLVGHWSSPGNDNLYFGGIDPADKTGSYTLVHPDGKVFTHRYEFKSEDPRDRTITVNMLFTGGDHRETIYVISADGQSIKSTTTITGIETNSQLTRVDDRTAP